jgi:hypothetical protein
VRLDHLLFRESYLITGTGYDGKLNVIIVCMKQFVHTRNFGKLRSFSPRTGCYCTFVMSKPLYLFFFYLYRHAKLWRVLKKNLSEAHLCLLSHKSKLMHYTCSLFQHTWRTVAEECHHDQKRKIREERTRWIRTAHRRGRHIYRIKQLILLAINHLDERIQTIIFLSCHWLTYGRFKYCCVF